jgi:hypothetical protein
VSPALVSEYQTWLPDKALLQSKLHEFYELAKSEVAEKALPALLAKKVAGKRKRKKSGVPSPHSSPATASRGHNLHNRDRTI